MTNPFCGACSRARLSSDGVLYTCLFATRGHDLRAPLRAWRQLTRSCWSRFAAPVAQRADRYSELRASTLHDSAEQKVEMYYIGG